MPTIGCKTPIAEVLMVAACADVEVMEVPTVGCKTPIAVVLNGADCADDDGMDVPTVGYMTPIADAVLADALPRLSKEPILSFSIIESRMVAVSSLAARDWADSQASRPSRSFSCLAAFSNSASYPSMIALFSLLAASCSMATNDLSDSSSDL